MTVLGTHDASHQLNMKDDMKPGLKSIAVVWQTLTILLLSILALLQVSQLAEVGVLLELEWSYFSVSVTGTALILETMMRRVRLEEADSCGWWF